MRSIAGDILGLRPPRPDSGDQPMSAPAGPAPTVSVIIPTRNRAELLLRAVHSVLSQRWTDLELIVVDDASTDHTLEVLGRIADPRLRVVRREKNGRAAAARNAGLAIARGSLIAFQDDDDIWLVDKLQKQVPHLQSAAADVGLCLCGLFSVTYDEVAYWGGEALFRQIDFSRGGGRRGPHTSMLSTPGWLLRKEWLDKAGHFDERMRSIDDWELALRLWKICRFTHVAEPLFIQDFRRATPGMTFNELALASDMELVTQKHGEMWKGKRRVQARHFYEIGKSYSHYSSAREGSRWLLRSIGQWPFTPRVWLALGAALLGQRTVARVTGISRAIKQSFRRALRPAR